MTKLKTVASVADILEREIEPTIKEWLRRVNVVSELRDIPHSDADRTGHLPKLFHDLTCRLRLTEVCDSSPPFLKSRKRFRIRQIIGGSARSLHEVSHARRSGTQDLGRVTTSF